MAQVAQQYTRPITAQAALKQVDEKVKGGMA